MRIYLVLYGITETDYGYHDCYTNEKEAIKVAEEMNETEKGMYYDYFVKYKDIKD